MTIRAAEKGEPRKLYRLRTGTAIAPIQGVSIGWGAMAEEKDQKDARVPRTSPTGAGAEATEGIHGADGDRAEAHNTGLAGKQTGRGSKENAHRAGSEPIESHDTEYRSQYGGGSREEDDSGQRSK